MMSEKDKQRMKIEQETREFIKKGGKIEQVETGKSGIIIQPLRRGKTKDDSPGTIV